MGNSDHSVIYAKCTFQGIYRIVANKLNYNKGDYASLRQSLDIDWDLLFEQYSNDVESMWTLFKEKIVTNSYKFIPLVKVFKCPSGKKWKRPLPEDVRNLVKKKSKAWKRCITTKSLVDINQYKKIRNEVRNATRTILRAE